MSKFSKISYEQFYDDVARLFDISSNDDNLIKELYSGIKLPKRGTTKSAGYDFFSPVNVQIMPGQAVTLPTGIRCEMEDNWVLTLHMRSSLGFKYQLALANTTGIIDADYFSADNEGHIMVRFVNRGNQPVEIGMGDKFVQGIFLQYGITEDDDVTEERTGGIGSTGK